MKSHRLTGYSFRKIVIIPLICFLVTGLSLTANETTDHHFVTTKYSADVSFFIADLKYSEETGVKICEVQHGVTSVFFGDRYLNGQQGIVSSNLYHTLLQYFDQSWTLTTHFADPGIKKTLAKAPEWKNLKNLKEIEKDRDFNRRAKLPVYDPHDLTQYHGLLAYRTHSLADYKNFQAKYPGVILLDAATHSYWKDKYKMTELFARNEKLASYKPKWNLYAKEYTNELTNKIIDDLQCDTFVIKPRGAFYGDGVIIVDKENLDDTLQYILIKSNKLRDDQDSSYSYWHKDPFDSLIVEEFAPSDPISVAHFDNKSYHPTMRVAFLLFYSNQTIDVKILYGYWLLPYLPLSEVGTLNQKYKAYCKVPCFCKADPQVLSKVETQLDEAFTLLYQQMLLDD